MSGLPLNPVIVPAECVMQSGLSPCDSSTTAAEAVATITTTAREIVSCCRRLGNTMQLGRHREDITATFAAASCRHPDIGRLDADLVWLCQRSDTATQLLSVALTCLEQSYHWPESCVGAAIMSPLPQLLQRMKLIVHHVLHPELRAAMKSEACDDTLVDGASCYDCAVAFAERAVRHGEGLIAAARVGPHFPPNLQFLTNLLFRTIHQDVQLQPSHFASDRHAMEFGALREVAMTHGVMRYINEQLESTGTLDALQRLVTSVRQPDAVPQQRRAAVLHAVVRAQVFVAVLMDTVVRCGWDLAVWGATYLRFAKAVAPSTQDGTGADTAAIHVMDAFVGPPLPKDDRGCPMRAIRHQREQYFPSVVREALAQLRDVRPAVAALVAADPVLASAFDSLGQQYGAFREMHRKLALGILVSLRSGGPRRTAAQHCLCPAMDPAPMSSELESRHVISATVGSVPVPVVDADVSFMCEVSGALQHSTQRLLPPQQRRLRATARVVRRCAVTSFVSTLVEVTANEAIATCAYEIGDRVALATSTEQPEATFTVISTETARGAFTVAVRDSANADSCAAVLCAVRDECAGPVHAFIRHLPAPRHRAERSYSATPGHYTSVARRLLAYIVQGTAAEGPILWTAAADASIPTMLVIAAGSVEHLLTLPELRALTQRHADSTQLTTPALRIVLCLTQPTLFDHEWIASVQLTAPCGRLTVHYGRVDAFFNANGAIARELASAAHGVVSGSTDFGAVVARHLAASEPEPAARAGRITRPRLPAFRYDVYTPRSRRKQSRLPEYTLAEVAQHNSPADAWIVIDGRVLNVTPFLAAHPGGEKVLAQFLGLDATRAFEAAHGLNGAEALGWTHALVIGVLAEPSTEESSSAAARTRGALADLVYLQNIAVNAGRTYAWPSASRPDDTTDASVAPPVFFAVNGIVGFARDLVAWGVRHLRYVDDSGGCGSTVDPASKLLLAAATAFEGSLMSRAAAATDDQWSAVSRVYAICERAWADLHSLVDRAKIRAARPQATLSDLRNSFLECAHGVSAALMSHAVQ